MSITAVVVVGGVGGGSCWQGRTMQEMEKTINKNGKSERKAGDGVNERVSV